MKIDEMDKAKMANGIKMFLEGAGLDLRNQHLESTPGRVAKTWYETFLSGYKSNPEDLIGVQFSDEYDQMIVVKDIPFCSMCAHHLLPFHGTAKIGYVPRKGRITGLSKLARVLELYSRRLQIQEQLTDEVAKAIHTTLNAEGVGVVIEAQHLCMTIRGITKPGSITVTSSLIGCMRTDSKARSEFMSL